MVSQIHQRRDIDGRYNSDVFSAALCRYHSDWVCT